MTTYSVPPCCSVMVVSSCHTVLLHPTCLVSSPHTQLPPTTLLQLSCSFPVGLFSTSCCSCPPSSPPSHYSSWLSVNGSSCCCWPLLNPVTTLLLELFLVFSVSLPPSVLSTHSTMVCKPLLHHICQLTNHHGWECQLATRNQMMKTWLLSSNSISSIKFNPNANATANSEPEPNSIIPFVTIITAQLHFICYKKNKKKDIR